MSEVCRKMEARNHKQKTRAGVPGRRDSRTSESVAAWGYGRAKGQLTVRTDSGFYAHALVSAWSKLDVRFSITIRQHASLCNLIEATPDGD